MRAEDPADLPRRFLRVLLDRPPHLRDDRGPLLVLHGLDTGLERLVLLALRSRCRRHRRGGSREDDRREHHEGSGTRVMGWLRGATMADRRGWRSPAGAGVPSGAVVAAPGSGLAGAGVSPPKYWLKYSSLVGAAKRAAGATVTLAGRHVNRDRPRVGRGRGARKFDRVLAGGQRHGQRRDRRRRETVRPVGALDGGDVGPRQGLDDHHAGRGSQRRACPAPLSARNATTSRTTATMPASTSNCVRGRARALRDHLRDGRSRGVDPRLHGQRSHPGAERGERTG